VATRAPRLPNSVGTPGRVVRRSWGIPLATRVSSVVNAGEIGAPLNGQKWVNYRGHVGRRTRVRQPGPYTPGSDGPHGSVYDDWSIDATGHCGEATCVPNQGMYVSHFSERSVYRDGVLLPSL